MFECSTKDSSLQLSKRSNLSRRTGSGGPSTDSGRADLNQGERTMGGLMRLAPVPFGALIICGPGGGMAAGGAEFSCWPPFAVGQAPGLICWSSPPGVDDPGAEESGALMKVRKRFTQSCRGSWRGRQLQASQTCCWFRGSTRAWCRLRRSTHAFPGFSSCCQLPFARTRQ